MLKLKLPQPHQALGEGYWALNLARSGTPNIEAATRRLWHLGQSARLRSGLIQWTVYTLENTRRDAGRGNPTKEQAGKRISSIPIAS